MRAEIAEVYDELDLDGEAMPRAGPRELGPPGGTFLVGFDQEGRPLCGELLGALEDAARELSYRIVRLDTGPRQPSAERMYRDAGYRPIDNFNQNPSPASSARSRWVSPPLPNSRAAPAGP